jgi:hypothetical protein
MPDFFVNSMSGVSLDRLDDLFGPLVTWTGEAEVAAIARVFGDANLDLIGTVMIRDAGLIYAVKRDGRRYSERRIQQWVAEADFIIRYGGIPATVASSLHAYLDRCMARAAEGAVARTGQMAPWRVRGAA